MPRYCIVDVESENVFGPFDSKAQARAEFDRIVDYYLETDNSLQTDEYDDFRREMEDYFRISPLLAGAKQLVDSQVAELEKQIAELERRKKGLKG